MNTKLLIRSSFKSLSHHKGRSFLTILGIIVGIAAIISTLAIGYGAEEKLRKSILAIGHNYIEIWAGKFQDGSVTSTKQRQPKKLTLNDIASFKLQCPAIKKVSPVLFDRGIIEYQGIPIMADIKGGNTDFLNILGRTIKLGNHFSHYQIQKGSRVAILGEKAAQELFKNNNPIGTIIKVKNIEFMVIGVIHKIKHYRGVRDPNLDIFIPYSAAKKYLKSSSNNKIHGIVISGKSLEVMPHLIRQLKKVLRARHNLAYGESDDFSLIDQQSMLKAAKASSSIFNIFLLIVASISLLVGGIGVMNIMLVSVTERTQEIGIRMALGAPSHVILKQFLIEAMALCFIGGIIGIILGTIAPFIAHYVARFPVVLKLQPIIVAFFTIFLIGLIFGFYPARKAARLNPVEALTEK